MPGPSRGKENHIAIPVVRDFFNTLLVPRGGGRRRFQIFIGGSVNVLRRVALPSYPGKGHAFPYFKVQVRDPRTLAWKDQRKGFDDEASARAYRASLSSKLETRIMRWDGTGAAPLDR